MSTICENTIDFQSYLSQLRNEKTLIVCGEQSARAASIAKTIATLKSNLDDVVVYSITETLPYISAIPKVTESAQIIAIGGGKVMDLAKLASLNLSQEDLQKKLQDGDYAHSTHLGFVLYSDDLRIR